MSSPGLAHGTHCSSVASSHPTSLHTNDGDNPRMDDDPSSCSLCYYRSQIVLYFLLGLFVDLSSDIVSAPAFINHPFHLSAFNLHFVQFWWISFCRVLIKAISLDWWWNSRTGKKFLIADGLKLFCLETTLNTDRMSVTVFRRVESFHDELYCE